MKFYHRNPDGSVTEVGFEHYMVTEQPQLRKDVIHGILVSTVFLGCATNLDGPPMLWETMVFESGAERRAQFASEEEALAFHEQQVDEIRRQISEHNAN